MVYFQVEINELSHRFSAGWTSIIAWISTATQIISVVLCSAFYQRDLLLSQHQERLTGKKAGKSTMNYPLERYFYGSSRNSSINNFNERWFDERYSQTATNAYIASGVTNDAFNGGMWKVFCDPKKNYRIAGMEINISGCVHSTKIYCIFCNW